MAEKSNNFLIILGVGILIGAAIVFSELRKQQLLQAQAQSAYTQAFAQQTQYLNDLNSTVKRLEGQVQVVQTLQPLPVLQPLKLLEPKLLESLKPLKPPTVDEPVDEPKLLESLKPLKPLILEAPAPATYKNNESWEFKRGPDQIIKIGDKTITIPGKLSGINVVRNAKSST